VSPWKVILATLVIFVAGLVTGAVGAKRLLKSPRPVPKYEPMQPWMLREQFRTELDRRLRLTPEQNARIERVMHEGQERVKEIWSLVGPEMQSELRAVREEIRRELTPEQRRRFDEMMRDRRMRPMEMDRPPGDRPPRPRPERPPPDHLPPPRDSGP
jgi:Spy/CpxP family protein refolding chaperone